MQTVKEMPSVTLVGDLIGSRAAADRGAVHARLAAVLASISEEFGCPVPLRMQAGDEFQGVFPSLGAALGATLRARLALLPDIDVRVGVGWGSVLVLQESPRVEDGPGWWAAREAIDLVKAEASRASLRGIRTRYVAAAGAGGADPAPVNAALMLRDQLVSGLSERSLSVLRGLLDGQSQKELADHLGISPSAVSQRVRADGLGVLAAAHDLTGGIR